MFGPVAWDGSLNYRSFSVLSLFLPLIFSVVLDFSGLCEQIQSKLQLRDHFFEPLFAIFSVKTIKLVTKRLINTLVEPYLLT